MRRKTPPERRPQTANQAKAAKAARYHNERHAAARTSNSPRPENRPPLSAERLIRIERRKARNRAIGLSIFVMAIMLVTVLLIIAVMQQARPRPRFMFIQEGELAHTVQSTGLILRDETVFNAPASGLLKPMTTEGSRVAKAQKLALVIPADKEEQLSALQKCEKDIVDLQTELMNSGKGIGAEAVFDESAASLTSIVALIRSDVNKGTLANLNAYATSISVILEQRTTKLMTIDFNDSRLDTLKEAKAGLERSLGLDSGTLVCEKPGIVSFKLDGLESALSQAAAATLTVSDYQKYIGQRATVPAVSQTVAKDQPVLRISSSLSQCLMFLLPDVDASLYKVDDLIKINIPADGITVENCRIIRSETSGSSALVVFKTDRKVEWLSDRRMVQAELPVSATLGLKVPASSLIDYDSKTGQASLMIVIKGYTRICKVDVIDQDREYAIIKAIESETYKPEVSTVLVANPDSIEAGESIDN